MLKLEKTSDLSNIAIRIREKEHFFETRLLKALAIAISFHVAALILFRITPFSFNSSFTFAPVYVQSDVPIKATSTLISYSTDEEEIISPPLSLIPALDWISFSQESTLLSTVAFDSLDLKSLEERVWPKWNTPLSIKLEEPRIQLTISGDLAALPLIASDPLLNEMQPISSHNSPTYVTYQVQLDRKTGEIFWYERITASAGPTIDQLTEKILLNLRFKPFSKQELVTGDLSFVILPFNENIF